MDLSNFILLTVLLVLLLDDVLTQEDIGLPAGADVVLTSSYVDTFSCEGQAYGYYADVDNNCEVFHICYPIADDTGTILEYKRWSFFCGNGTVFDQQALVCNHPEDAFPCAESPSLYGQIEFGVVDPDY